MQLTETGTLRNLSHSSERHTESHGKRSIGRSGPTFMSSPAHSALTNSSFTSSLIVHIIQSSRSRKGVGMPLEVLCLSMIAAGKKRTYIM
jgi:hypothetical protein